MPLITINQVQKYYGDNHVLKGVDLDVDHGEVISIIGRSGSGKSTLLRCMNGLEGYQEGSIKLGGMTITDRESQAREISRSVGMVFQNFNLFPHMTALQNVTEGLVSVKGVAKGVARERGLALLGKVGLAQKADAYPGKLSGGQKQRVAIARALAMDPEVILFDEPTSALDPELRDDVLNVMRALAAEGMTMLVVTHETRFAREVADRIIFMEDGHVLDDTTPALFFGAQGSERSRQFLGRLHE